MLRFFRHKRKQPMQQKKNIQYLKYAFGEVILVVLGVVIALQLNNWNQDRIDRKEEKRIINDLLIEFHENQEALEFSVKFQKQKTALYFTLLSADLSNYTIEQLDSISFKAYDSWTFNASLGIYNSLINSGKLDLLQNTTLKNKIAKFKDAAIDYSEDEIELSERTSNLLSQWFIKQEIVDDDPKVALGIKKRTPQEEIKDKQQILHAFNDQEYQRIILILLTYLQSFDEEGDYLVSELDEIIELLKMEADN